MRRTLVTTMAGLAGLTGLTATLAPPATADRPPLIFAGDRQAAPAAGDRQAPPIATASPATGSQTAAFPWGADASPLMRPGRAVTYWTAAKQAAATPADLPRSSEPKSRIGAARTAAPLSVPAAERLTPGGDVNGYARVPRPYTAVPYSRISGRLFFINSSGQGDSCTASVVRSASGLLIATAAHCVYSVPEGTTTGRWHRDFAFVPAYDGRATSVREREPYGRWGGRRAWKPDGYTGLHGGDWNSSYDIALIEVGWRGRTLQDAVGAFTPMLNQGGRHVIATTGYPGLPGRQPYDGRDQLWCLGRTRQTAGVAPAETLLAARSTRLPALGRATGNGRMETYNCHLYKGHSGGPWFLKDTGDLVGVLSAGKEDGEADGNSVATALNLEGYGAIVRQADPNGVYDALSVKLTGPAKAARRGENTTVTATVTMRGVMAAARVPVTLSVPRGAALTAVHGVSCRPTRRQATCVIPAVRPGRPVEITARLHVAAGAPHRLPVTARVVSTRLDPDQRDNTATLRLRTRR
ncbi:trypsin-like serine peptidase [Nonomuraea sp. NPDC049309]|uniref:trypsin-like serine peptidase n=1 Tax=Nonomuraea sp. NPDC049309 TaxID=3364350 RepID=UPI0037234537